MSRTAPNVDAAALESLRESFGGAVIVPGHKEYDAARVVWNGTIDRYPALIARCTRVADVIAAIRFARDQGLIVAVRGGGHSVGGFSTCDDGIVIDLSGMRGVRVDPQARTARVNGGAHLSELDHAAQEFGLACPVGVVGHTGVGGLTLGGGMGRLMRKFGYTIDNLLAVEMVTADGDLIHVSEDENAELFWGMRGAGANFGAVTSFEFRLHPVGPMVTEGKVLHLANRAHQVVALYRELAAIGPEELMLSLEFGVATPDLGLPAEMEGRPLMMLGATHCGSLEDAERDLEPIRDSNPLLDTFDAKTYLSLQSSADEDMAWGKRFYMKGGFVDDLTDEAVDAFVEQVTNPPGDCSIGLWAQGGAISRVPDDAMAFTGRNAGHWIGAETFWDDPSKDADFIEWGRSAWDAIIPFTTAGHYVNDMIESGEDVVRSIYGDEKYERLVALKRRFDPENVFRLNQNVKP